MLLYDIYIRRYTEKIRIMSRLVIFFICFFFANSAFSSEEQDIGNFINKTVRNIMNVAASNSTDRAKRDSLSKLFRDVVDGVWMSRFAIGGDWNKLTKEQKDKYSSNYAKYIECLYVDKFKMYNGNQKNELIAVRELPRDQAIAETKITNGVDGKDYNINYRLRKDKGNWKIIDIIVEGISLITTQRSDFRSKIATDGIDSLISSMGDKIKKCC